MTIYRYLPLIYLYIKNFSFFSRHYYAIFLFIVDFQFFFCIKFKCVPTTATNINILFKHCAYIRANQKIIAFWSVIFRTCTLCGFMLAFYFQIFIFAIVLRQFVCSFVCDLCTYCVCVILFKACVWWKLTWKENWKKKNC